MGGARVRPEASAPRQATAGAGCMDVRSGSLTARPVSGCSASELPPRLPCAQSQGAASTGWLPISMPALRTACALHSACPMLACRRPDATTLLWPMHGKLCSHIRHTGVSVHVVLRPLICHVGMLNWMW